MTRKEPVMKATVNRKKKEKRMTREFRKVLMGCIVISLLGGIGCGSEEGGVSDEQSSIGNDPVTPEGELVPYLSGNSSQISCTVQFISPTEGQWFKLGDPIKVTTRTSCTGDGYTSGRLYLDGVRHSSSLLNLGLGTHVIKAEVRFYDQNLNYVNSTSATVTIKVVDLSPSFCTVKFISPTEGQNFQLGNEIKVTTQVYCQNSDKSAGRLLLDGVPTSSTMKPALGTHTITAQVTNTFTNNTPDFTKIAASATVTIKVVDLSPSCTVKFISPTEGQNFQLGNEIKVTTQSSCQNSDQLAGRLLLDGVPTSSTMKPAAGTHTITAQLTTTFTNNIPDFTKIAASATVTIKVVDPWPSSCTVKFISPTEGQVFKLGDTIKVTTNIYCQNSDQSAGRLLLDGVPTSSTMKPALGTHTITAQVTTTFTNNIPDFSNIAASATVTIKVE
jgi:hypothetical protein